MKCTKIMLSGVVAFAATANAMPTQEQTKKVEPLVMDLMREDQAALKSGKKTRVEVAESAMELADKAESEAAKLLLIKGAFNLYVRAGEFDKAIETLQTMQTAIPDMPPANMVNIIEAALRVVSRKNGGQLYRLLDETKTRMRYTNEAASLEKSVKKNPADRALRTRLAEHYAYLGKWDMALENFAATDGKVGAIAKSEREGKAAAEKVADFWWNYPTGKADELVKCFRTHAAKLYEDAIDSGDIKGLNKVQAERRIEEAKGYGELPSQECDMFSSKVAKLRLSSGVELELIKCPAGEFTMGYESWNTWGSSLNREPRKLHRVRLTKDFMLGKFPVTCSQWYAIMGNGKKAPTGLEDTPVGNITVPEMQAFCDKLTKKFKTQLGGKVFRLPTDAEWEYASKGGKDLNGMLGKASGRNGQTGSSSRDGKEAETIFRQMGYTAEDHARASDTKKPFFMWNTLPVGKHKPNEWGFMDFTGNAWEVTADKMMDLIDTEYPELFKDLRRWNGHQRYSDFEIDPLLKGDRHLIRTGFWDKGVSVVGNKNSIGDNDRFPAVGFRVCVGEALGNWNNATASKPTESKMNDFKEPVPNVEYKFSYKLEGGNAIITGIDPKPVGTVVIPDKIDGHKVTGIEGYNDRSPFWGCDQLTRVVLPAGLELGPADAFFSCKSLSSIEISRSNKKFASRDGALYSKDFSTLIVYPKTRESVKLSPKTRKVGVCAFRGCALKTAKIPEGIVEVEPWNLCRCPDLELIEFPKSLKHLGQCAAHGNDKLKKIVFNGDAPQVGLGQFSWGKQYVFTGAPEDLVVEVRKGTKGWKSPSSTELPERWPTNQSESRPIRYIK